MRTTDSFTSLSHAGKFRLSSRGASTAAAYRSQVVVIRRPTPRTAFDRARANWALDHGLELDDGMYLSELDEGSLTLQQLGEGLAICSQTREMISAALVRLISRGFVEQVAREGAQRGGPTRDTAHEEMVMAESELLVVRGDVEGDQRGDSRMITDTLRHALSRLVAARRFRDSFSSRG